MGFDAQEPDQAPAPAAAEPAPAPAAPAPQAAAGESTPGAAPTPPNAAQAKNPVLASLPPAQKTLYSSEQSKDDGEGDTESTKSEVKGSLNTEDKTVDGDASRTSSSETKDAVTGGSTKSDTTVKANATIGVDGGKGSASASHSDSQDRGDGSKTSASTTATGGVEVKDGKTSVDGGVSSERNASYEDKDTGESNASSNKAGVDVHIADGDTHAGASYDGSRSSNDGAGNTSQSTTHADGHLGEQGSGGKASYASTTGTDDKEGDTTSQSTSASGGVNVDKDGHVSADGNASHSSSTETKDAVTGGSTKSDTTVKGDVALDKDGGKGNASVAHTDSQDTGDGTKNSSTTTGSAGVTVKDGKASADGAVSSERAASTEDKDSGESTSRSDKVGVDVHVADGDTHAGASYDRNRSTDDGATKTSDTTKAEGHVGDKDSGASASQTSTTDTKQDASGRTIKTETSTSGGVKTDDKGNTTVDAARKSSNTEGDGSGATETASNEASAKVGVDKDGKLSADAAGKTSRDWNYKDESSPLATSRGGSADGSVHVDADKASVQGSGEAHRSNTDEDGNSTGQSGKATAGATTNAKGETTYNADGTIKSTQGYADEDSKVDGSTEKSATASVSSSADKTEVKGDIAGKKTMSDGDGNSAENTAHGGGGVSVNKDGTTTVTGSGGTSSKQTLATADGSNSKTTATDGSMSVSSDGSMKGTGSRTTTNEETHKDADGKETKTGVSNTVNATVGQDADGTVHGGAGGGRTTTTTDADGNTSSRGYNASGEVIVGPGKEGASGKVGMTQDGTSASVNAGYMKTIGEPVKNADGTYSVPYSSTKSGGVDASEGKDAKLGGSASASSSTFGARTFANEDEAKAFQKAGEVPATEIPKTAEDAAKLPPGTTIGNSQSASVGGSASAKVGVADVGGKAEVHDSNSIAVTSKGNGVVEVTASQGSGESASATVGAPGAGMGVGGNHDSDTSKRVQFDLTTEDGKAAYNAYLKDPTKVPDKGATVQQTTEHTQDGTSWNANVGPVAMGEKDTLDKTVTKDADGNVVGTDDKGTTSSNVAVPFLGGAHEATSMNVHTDKDGNASYAVHKDIDDTSASDANAALAKATGTYEDKNVDGKTAGKWSVDTTYSDKTMQSFAQSVKDGTYNPQTSGGIGNQARADLQNELAQAQGDPAKEKAALANFTKNGGDDAVKQIADATGDKGEQHVGLAGDKYLTGAEGRSALDQQIADTQKSVADGSASVGDVRALLAAQKERAREVGNPANYPELPAGVRAQETARSQADIDKLQAALDQAKDDREAMKDPSDPTPDVPNKSDPSQPAGAVDPTEAQAKMKENTEAMDQARADNDKAYTDARLQHKIQDGYNEGYAGQSPRQQLGDKTFGVFDNTETKAYGDADKSYADAQAALKEANKQEGIYDRTGDDNAADTATSAAAAQKAADNHRIATQKFAEAQAAYKAIADRNKNSGDVSPGTFDGESTKQLQPGE